MEENIIPLAGLLCAFLVCLAAYLIIPRHPEW